MDLTRQKIELVSLKVSEDHTIKRREEKMKKNEQRLKERCSISKDLIDFSRKGIVKSIQFK